VFAELPLLADGVQHLPHQVFVRQLVGVVPGAAAVLGLEIVDQGNDNWFSGVAACLGPMLFLTG